MEQSKSDTYQTGVQSKTPPFRPIVPELQKNFGRAIMFKFYKYREGERPDVSSPAGITNLEYVIAQGDHDLSGRLALSASAPSEERAFLLISSFVAELFGTGDSADTASSSIQVFQKHMMQSRLGTHCIFALRREGIEIEEQSFVVHLDQSKRVVMLSCTYLPDLPALFEDPAEFPEEPIRQKLQGIEYEIAKAERQWLITLHEDRGLKSYRIAPGSQVKLSLPTARTQSITSSRNQANLLTVTASGIQKKYRSSPGAVGKSIGLGKITRSFFLETDKSQGIEALSDDNIKPWKNQAVLRNLESNAELVGRYAAVQDEIDNVTENKRGIFTEENGSSFDRVNAYYHLDYIQRYFREILDFQILDDYPHLNPVRIVLKYERSALLAEYDVIKERIFFYQIKKTETTAARDPRFIYHEFVHIVTDAIARLPRGGAASATARSQETLQAQAMDEGIADYFACSLARQQGAQRASFYFVKNGRWKLDRDLEPAQPSRLTIGEFKDINESTWRTAKYRLGEQWARSLWRLRQQLGPEVTDMLIAHSIFFLTRWATLRQGIQALRLSDRLLFSEEHKKEISEFEDQISLILDEKSEAERFSAV